MFKPLFLGISDGTTGGWWIFLCILIILIVIAGIIVYYTGYYIIKLITRFISSTQLKFNGRQIGLHFLATWLFIICYRYLACLSNVRLFKLLTETTPEHISDVLLKDNVTTLDVARYVEFVFSWYWALLAALLISLTISIKRHWFWGNSVVAILVSFLFYRSWLELKDIPYWHKTIYFDPVPKSVGWYLVVGILFLSAGLLLFFSKKTNRYIESSGLAKLKFNGRQLGLHFLATWLFIVSFRYLAYLSNTRILNTITLDRNPFNLDEALKEEKIPFYQFASYSVFVNHSWLLAIFAALILSLIISFIKHWSWINAVLVFILAYFSYIIPFKHLSLARWHWVTFYNPVPNSVAGYLTMGMLCLFLGLLIFLLSPINAFIDRITSKEK